MTRREYQGRSAAEAAIKACEQLGVTRSALKYEVVSETGEGLERRVVIAVDVDQAAAAAAAQPADDEEPPRRPREEGARGGESYARGGRGGDRPRRGGGRGGDRGGRGPRRDERMEARPRGGRGGRRGDRPHDRPRDEERGVDEMLGLDIMPTEPVEHRPEITAEASERAAAAKQVLAELIRLTGIEVQPRLVEDGVEEIHFDLVGAGEAQAIGNKGETLLSLQFLTNRILTRTNEVQPHIVLDAANYRSRRKEALANLARTLAGRAVEERKVVRLSPMSAHDRRIVHITLQDHGGVTTRSEGEGLYRPLLIVPTPAE